MSQRSLPYQFKCAIADSTFLPEFAGTLLGFDDYVSEWFMPCYVRGGENRSQNSGSC